MTGNQVRPSLASILFLFALLLSGGSMAADDPASAAKDTLVLRVYYDRIENIRALQAFDLFEYRNTKEGYVLVAVRPEELPRLEELGFPLEIDEAMTAEMNAEHPALAGQTTGIPGFPCYRTVEETFASAEQIVAQHPDLASWVDVGDSWEKTKLNGGYDLRVLRLTQSAMPGPKPKQIITSSIHAREYAPAELVTRYAEFLVAGYGLDADVTWLLDYHEVHLMFQANPDGRKLAETGLSWRKNTNQNHCFPTSNLRGADLNRNFAFEWACCDGSSPVQCNELYHGPAPASEPETRAIQAYLTAQFPDQREDDLISPAPQDAVGIYMDIHAFSRLVLWPWGFTSQSPNDSQHRTLGRKLAWFNDYVPKRAFELYPSDGTSIDFSYGTLGVASFAFELGTAYFQSCNMFENVILPDNLPALFLAGRVARAPFMLPSGPDALGTAVTPEMGMPGGLLTVTATLDDTRFSTAHFIEPVQNISDAELYVDTPPWLPQAVPVPMSAVDGVFDETVEEVSGVLSTAGLSAGRHILYVRGKDANGDWGVVGAAFFHMLDPLEDSDDDGIPNDLDCLPFDPMNWRKPSPAEGLYLFADEDGTITWFPPADPGAVLVEYDVLKSEVPSDFDSADCVASATSETSITEGADPIPGLMWTYLVRSRNGCGGNLGADSAGAPRDGVSCP